MSVLKYIFDLIASWLTNQNYMLGDKIFEAGAPNRLSCLTDTPFGLFVGVYDGERREKIHIFLNGAALTYGECETIGQGLVSADGKSVWFACEKGSLRTFTNGVINKGFNLKFASTCCMFNGKPYVFNTDGQVWAINILTGVREFQMPGGGIITAALEDNGKLYAVSGDGGAGISCNDSVMISVSPPCQCIAGYNGRIFVSSANRLMEKVGNTVTLIDTLPCEKLMHFDVGNGLLWVAGANPDALWCYNQLMSRKEILNFHDTNNKVGGSVFRTRVVAGKYFGRWDGKLVMVYTIKGA